VCIAALTNAEDRRRGYFYDPQFARRHDCSLAHRAGGHNAWRQHRGPLLKRREKWRTRLTEKLPTNATYHKACIELLSRTWQFRVCRAVGS
jgi:hypothetical protein